MKRVFYRLSALGGMLLLPGLATLTGGDKVFEERVVDHAPARLNDLGTGY